MEALIKEIEILPFNAPLHEPFQIALGTYYDTKNVLVKVHLANGIIGYGEGSEAGFVTGDVQETMIPALNYVKPLLLNTKINKWQNSLKQAKALLVSHPAAYWGLETALLDAFAKSLNMPLYQYLGGVQESVKTDITIAISTAEHAKELAKKHHEAGFDCFKIKVGHGLQEDLERVQAVAETVEGCRIRVDANQGYTPKEAELFIQAAFKSGYPIEVFEQPVRKDDYAGLKYVRDHSPVPVAADESVFSAADAYRLVKMEAVDVINIKLAKSGGIMAALDIIALAKVANVQLMIGCMLETNVGIASSVHLACGTGAFSYLDLDGHLLLSECPLKGGFVTEGDSLRVDENKAGLGISE